MKKETQSYSTKFPNADQQLYQLPHNGKSTAFYSKETSLQAITISQISMFQKIINSGYSKTTITIRLLVGAVFLSEGIQKLLFPTIRCAGRLEKIGLPSPEFLGAFVGTFEIVCGALILLGFLTRLTSIPTLVIMLVAIATSKAGVLANGGFWAMLLGSLFMIIKGGGKWSLDSTFQKNN